MNNNVVPSKKRSHYKLFVLSNAGRVTIAKTLLILTSILVLSQISANEDLLLPTVSSSSFTLPLRSMLMLPEWFASIARGRSLRKADLCSTRENTLGSAWIVCSLTTLKAQNYQSCSAVNCVPVVSLSRPVLSWHLLRIIEVHLFVLHLL